MKLLDSFDKGPQHFHILKQDIFSETSEQLAAVYAATKADIWTSPNPYPDPDLDTNPYPSLW